MRLSSTATTHEQTIKNAETPSSKEAVVDRIRKLQAGQKTESRKSEKGRPFSLYLLITFKGEIYESAPTMYGLGGKSTA